jgi:hypothetical protein
MTVATNAPDVLRILWKDRVFLSRKTLQEIGDTLSKRGSDFPANTLALALSSAKYLTRSGGKGHSGCIQKHPYVEEGRIPSQDENARRPADHERRIKRLEALLEKRPPVRPSSSSGRKSLPSHILALRDAGYFKEPRVTAEVHQKLAPTYRCERKRVDMALFRLGKAGELRKITKVVGERKLRA